MCTDTLACEALTCTRLSRMLFPQDLNAGAEEAPRRALNIAAALSCFALMSGTQPSHSAFVVVLVSRNRASLSVALSTCQLSLLAVALWMSVPTVGGGVSKARGAEEPLGSGTTVHDTVGPSQVLRLLWRSVPTDVKPVSYTHLTLPTKRIV